MKFKNNVIIGNDDGNTWYKCSCCKEWFKDNVRYVKMSCKGDPYCSQACQDVKSPLLAEIKKLHDDIDECD